LFGVRPQSVCEWSGPEALHALRACDGQLPVSEWLHLALADLCIVMGDARKHADILRAWGFEIVRESVTDEDLIEWMGKHGSIDQSKIHA
jgi:hypothetical protein